MFEEIRIEGNFTLSSGRKSKFFYDFNLLPSSEVFKYTEDLFHLTAGIEYDFVVAPAIGGIIPGYLFSLFAKCPLLVLDKQQLMRGGLLFSFENYLIVDDVLTSYKTADRIREYFAGDYTCLAYASYIFRGSDKDLRTGTYFLERKEEEK